MSSFSWSDFFDNMSEKRKIIIVKGCLMLRKGMLNDQFNILTPELREELKKDIADAEKWLKEHDEKENQKTDS